MGFDEAALMWDNEQRIGRAKVIARQIYNEIKTEQNLRALEFGCGTGLVSFNLADKFEHITLLDTSGGMIEMLNKKIKEAGITNMSAFQADINDNPAMYGSFDVIYSSMALHHIADVRTTLANLYTLLQSSGYLCIVDLNEDDGSFHKAEKDFSGHNGFDQNALKGLTEELGYKNATVNTFYQGDKIMDDTKVPYSLFLLSARK